jgi:aldehyde:ferredoxin oxidoreductase
MGLYNVLDVCIFVGVPEYRMMKMEQLLELINNVTGWNISFWELIKISEKGINMARLFNIKHAYNHPQFKDQLPQRFFNPLENGAHKGKKIDKDEFANALKYITRLEAGLKMVFLLMGNLLN